MGVVSRWNPSGSTDDPNISLLLKLGKTLLSGRYYGMLPVDWVPRVRFTWAVNCGNVNEIRTCDWAARVINLVRPWPSWVRRLCWRCLKGRRSTFYHQDPIFCFLVFRCWITPDSTVLHNQVITGIHSGMIHPDRRCRILGLSLEYFHFR